MNTYFLCLSLLNFSDTWYFRCILESSRPVVSLCVFYAGLAEREAQSALYDCKLDASSTRFPECSDSPFGKGPAWACHVSIQSVNVQPLV